MRIAALARFAFVAGAVAAGCHHAPPVAPSAMVVVAAPPPTIAPEPPKPIWPMPVRVMVWSEAGPTEIGELPDHPPAALPALWYVEPIGRVTPATFPALVDALRSQHVPGLSLRGQAAAALLAGLRDVPELIALGLDDTDVDAAALAHIDAKLVRIYTSRTPVDDAALAALAEHQPALEVVSAEDCAITDAGVRALAPLRELRALDLDGTAITDAGGARLGGFAKLVVVDLGHTKVGARTVDALRALPLQELFLDGTQVGPELGQLQPLASTLVRIDVSNLSAHRPTDREVGWLASAPNLVEVGLGGAAVHDPLVRALARLPKLREIRLAGTPITIAAIRELVHHPDLEDVDLALTPIDDDAAILLVGAPHMRALRLDKTSVDDAALAISPSPELRELYLSNTRVTDAGLALLDATPALESLGFAVDNVGDVTLRRVAKLAHLRTLVLDETFGSRAVLASLGALTALERLYLEQTATDDAVVAALAPARGLRILHLANTKVTPAALGTLRGFAQLEELTLGSTLVGSGFGDLASWPRLHTLSAFGLPLDDAAVRALATHRPLVVLDLSATDVHELAPLESLPHLQLLGLVATKLDTESRAVLARLKAKGVEVEQ